jgi:hypothetical protein
MREREAKTNLILAKHSSPLAQDVVEHLLLRLALPREPIGNRVSIGDRREGRGETHPLMTTTGNLSISCPGDASPSFCSLALASTASLTTALECGPTISTFVSSPASFFKPAAGPSIPPPSSEKIPLPATVSTRPSRTPSVRSCSTMISRSCCDSLREAEVARAAAARAREEDAIEARADAVTSRICEERKSGRGGRRDRRKRTNGLELSVKRTREARLLTDETHRGQVDHVVERRGEYELRCVANLVRERLREGTMSGEVE